jgi:poly-gamma-glutamate synthesis protein (capsule biosynthesis protein)
VWESVVASWKLEDGALKELHLHPITLGDSKKRYQRGWPELSSDTTVIERLAELSKPFGTEIEIRGNKGVVTL